MKIADSAMPCLLVLSYSPSDAQNHMILLKEEYEAAGGRFIEHGGRSFCWVRLRAPGAA
jgi:hypothetical protein